jgi:hypothetical protein
MTLKNAWNFTFVTRQVVKVEGRRVLVTHKNGRTQYVDFEVPEGEYFAPDDLAFMKKKLFLKGVKDLLHVRDAGLTPEKPKARRHLEGHRERASHGLRIHESRVGEAAWWESRRVPSMAREAMRCEGCRGVDFVMRLKYS